MKNYYAVRVGHRTGIYNHFEDAEIQTRGFSGAEWKGFYDYEAAKAYLHEKVIRAIFYVVANVIYSDWKEARKYSGGGRPDEFRTLKAARQFVWRDYNYHVERLRQDLSFINTNGRTVWQVYTDGACSMNGQPGASAGIGVYFGANNSLNISKPLGGSLQTNQRAELAAIKEAYLRIDSLNDGELYMIYTDSAYALNCLTIWCDNWEYYGWTNSRGLPVANQDLIRSILEIRDRNSCRGVLGIQKVDAHSDCEGNNEADRLAGAGIRW